MKHRENPKTVFLCSLQLEKIRTSRAYVRKSQYAKHGWDIVTKYNINNRDMAVEV